MNNTAGGRIHEREHGLCFVCFRQGTQVHHIVAKSQFGKKERALQEHEKNKCLLCDACHDDYANSHDNVVRLMGLMHDFYGYDYMEPKFRPWAAEMYAERNKVWFAQTADNS